MSEGFTFVDATYLIANAVLWENRDKARHAAAQWGCHWAAIRRKTMTTKNRDRDRGRHSGSSLQAGVLSTDEARALPRGDEESMRSRRAAHGVYPQTVAMLGSSRVRA